MSDPTRDVLKVSFRTVVKCPNLELVLFDLPPRAAVNKASGKAHEQIEKFVTRLKDQMLEALK